MGILEEIRDQNAKILALLEGGAAPAADAKPAAKKTTTKKEEPKKPAFSAEDLRDKFLAVQEKHGDAVAKALIKDCGHEKLAQIIGDAENWQSYWDKAEAKLEEEPEGDDNGGL